MARHVESPRRDRWLVRLDMLDAYALANEGVSKRVKQLDHERQGTTAHYQEHVGRDATRRDPATRFSGGG